MNLGVIEGFFGPAWENEARLSYAPFLKRYGGDFYIYAPKQDQNLRKKWRDEWGQEYQDFLLKLSLHFKTHGISFGVALSPFALGDSLTETDKIFLDQKVKLLEKLGVDILGVFFDDMPVQENLAQSQIEAMNFIGKSFSKEIIFCPTFYTFDPILEKVFGKMPDNYLNDIARGIAPHIHLAWTGPKVISPEIPSHHLDDVSKILKRKPFIWENIFANDGPKNCKFLKLKPFAGREQDFTEHISGCGFNMMNQAYLSQISFLSAKYFLAGVSAETSWAQALSDICSPEFKVFLLKHQDTFLTLGLDQLSEDERRIMMLNLKTFTEPAAVEISRWLNGNYLVGSECLTD